MNCPNGCTVSLAATCCVLLLLFPVQLLAKESSSGSDSGNDTASNQSMVNSFKCEHNWHQHKRRCFYLINLNQTFTFEEARTACYDSYQAALASIEDKEAQDAIADLLNAEKAIHSPDNRVWIGARWEEHENHDDHTGGGWHWAFTEASLNYSNWLGEKPTGHQPGMCAITQLSDSKWRSVNCSESATLLLCERDLERPITKDNNMAWAIMYALVGLLLVGLLCGCCVYCIVTRNRDRRRGSGGKFRGIYYKRSSSSKNKTDNGNGNA